MIMTQQKEHTTFVMGKRPVIGLLFGWYFMVGFFNSLSAQQNIQFTQYLFNTLAVNPAYAGYKEDLYLQVLQRNQWVGLPGSPRTTQVSVDGTIDGYTKNVGLGLQITADKLGAQSASSVYANYAYRLQLDNADLSRLCLGLAVGVSQYATDMTLLNPLDEDDPLLTRDTIIWKTYVPDVRLGVYYYNTKFFAGLSVMDLFSGSLASSLFKQRTEGVCNALMRKHLYLVTGGLFDLSENTKLRPSFLIKEDFKGPTSLDIGALLVFENRFWVGASYSTAVRLWNKSYSKGQSLEYKNALSGIVELQVTERLRLGYSYDYALNNLNGEQGGTHELTLGLLIPRKYRRVLSPRFF